MSAHNTCTFANPFIQLTFLESLSGGSDDKESACSAGDLDLIPGSGRSLGKIGWQPTPVFLTGDFHGQRSLVGWSPWGCNELHMTEWPTFWVCLCVYVCIDKARIFLAVRQDIWLWQIDEETMETVTDFIFSVAKTVKNLPAMQETQV